MTVPSAVVQRIATGKMARTERPFTTPLTLLCATSKTPKLLSPTRRASWAQFQRRLGSLPGLLRATPTSFVSGSTPPVSSSMTQRQLIGAFSGVLWAS